jgi:hypothetical protein
MDIRRPSVRAETEFGYTDKASGRRLSFTPKTDEAMVTFQERISERRLNDIIQATPLSSVSQGFNLDRGFAAIHVAPDQDMEAAVRALEGRPEIANSLPVMVDQDGLERYFLPDEFTAQFREGVAKERAERIIRESDSRIIVEQRTPGYYTLAVPEGKGLFETIQQFSDLEEVFFAEPSEVSFNSALTYIPDDTDFSRLWGLHNTGQTVNGTTGVADADIDAPEAWDLVRGDPDVIVAVIDTGADLGHPDLQANLLPRGTEDWDFADTNDPSPDDTSTNGHGTHVAGTAAAVDNAAGVIGVAPGCRVMPLRVDLQTGMNPNRADAINYASWQAISPVQQPLRGTTPRRYVINCSWKMNGDHAGVRTAIQTAVNRNVVVVLSAGNDNQNTDVTPQYPGVYPQVIAVAALTQDDSKASFSNFGTNVDVCAPGENIYSTVLNNAHGFLDGTSMAAPHVAGLAALVWSANRDLTNLQVRQVIEEACDNIDAANPASVSALGRGRINAFRAVSRARVPGTLIATPITARHSGKVLDVEGISTANGAWVHQWDNRGAGNQKWRLEPVGEGYYRVVAEHSGKVLDVANGSTANGAGVVQWDYWGGDNQKWKPELVGSGYYRLVAKHSGKVLDVAGISPANGAQLTQWDYVGGDNQLFLLEPANDAYPIVAKHSGRVLDVEGISTANGAQIHQWDYVGGGNQLFRLRPVGDGYYRVVVRHSGKVLDVANGSTANGAGVVQWDYWGGDNQKWSLEPVGDGYYKLVAKHSGKVLDVAGISSANGAKLHQWDYVGGDNQKWKL